MAGIERRTWFCSAVRALATVALVAMLGGCITLPPASRYPTAPPSEIPANGVVAVLGDLQMTSWLVRAATRAEHNLDAQARLLTDLAAQRETLDGLVLLGDLVYNAASRRDWAHFDMLLLPFVERVPVLPALGNHDYYCLFMHLCTQRVVPRNVRLRFPWLVAGQAYWVSYGTAALVFLDSETRIADQGRWLAAALDEIEPAHDALVVFTHRPPYTVSTARGLEPELALRTALADALAQTPLVSVVVSGHAHGYEHALVDGRHYIVSGGGGGPRSPLAPERPDDVYAGRDCAELPSGHVLRPFNYLLLHARRGSLEITVRGFCSDDATVDVLERFTIAVPERTRLANTP